MRPFCAARDCSATEALAGLPRSFPLSGGRFLSGGCPTFGRIHAVHFLRISGGQMWESPTCIRDLYQGTPSRRAEQSSTTNPASAAGDKSCTGKSQYAYEPCGKYGRPPHASRAYAGNVDAPRIRASGQDAMKVARHFSGGEEGTSIPSPGGTTEGLFVATQQSSRAYGTLFLLPVLSRQ